MNEINGALTAKNRTIAVVLARFNTVISEQLLLGAIDCIERHEGSKDNITIVRVPGSFEIPLIAKKLAETKKYDAVICLGAIIRGDTPHFDYVAAESAKGIASTSLNLGIPIINGILTTDDIEQALNRAGIKSGNKGFDAALAAIEMISVLKEIGDKLE